ncbi:MAG: D-alanine--D-alanine ligase [Rhabdochlamydiaceae bacterium]|nr:D-alanine--D-alanine ligase [Candidatus Amphrikana amoebophyrae]
MEKIKLGLIFGGKSGEHEVSCRSAEAIFNNLDGAKYCIEKIWISKDLQWFHVTKDTKRCITSELVPFLRLFDLLFPIIHGPNGEDGTLQGLLRFIDRPFVGCDVLSTAICMDKEVTKRLLEHANILVAPYLLFKEEVEKCLVSYPAFVKPANNGSSIGISRVENESELNGAISLALAHDKKVLIESAIDGDEVECAVFGNEDPRVSLPGRFRNIDKFYSYEAKYGKQEATTFEIPAKYPKELILQIQELALKVYRVLGCEGMARVDMFVTNERKIYVNEVNTHPGFTAISLYPQMWEASGVPFSDLLDILIDLAIQRKAAQQIKQPSPSIQ